jgi:hypothetical protein
MRNLLPMRSRLDIVFREHDMRDLVVSQDQDMVRIRMVAGEDHVPCAGGGTRHAEKDSKAHVLAPATGITVGIGLSIMLWSFIILVVFLVGF